MEQRSLSARIDYFTLGVVGAHPAVVKSTADTDQKSDHPPEDEREAFDQTKKCTWASAQA
jgi:hypothetical protein